ncbi:RusA family crossover junction endodeoxyribonuclease [Pantoea dispersa]|uniref:RusA family crossover junction endodeoxyribonuclease n=1 Tax=Pantoea dispersa TaxID=59814 RepID=UPI003015BE72
MKLTLPFPPSVNTYWRNTRKGVLISASGRSFRSNALADILEQLRRAPQPITVNVAVSVILYPPDKRPRDLDNYLKAAFDSLTHAGVWVDDKQIKRFAVEWGPLTKGGKTEITINPYSAIDGSSQDVPPVV